MEFRYRAGDRRPPSGLSYSSSQAAPIQGTDKTNSPNSAAASNLDHGKVWGQNRSLGLTTHDDDDVVQRQLEKEQIRREIVAAEERRKLLEAEVRWELVMEQRERLMSMQQHHRSNVDGKFSGRAAVTTTERFAFADRVCGGSATEEHRRIMSELNHSERRSVFEEKEKPNTNVSGEKQKTNTTIDFCCKKPDGEWSCALCKVSATSQKGLSDHLQGKKHKAKEQTLGAKNREASKPKLSSGDSDLSSETELVKEVKKEEEKDDVKFEGQRNTNLSGDKRKRNTITDFTTTDLCCKKPDGEWSNCALCEVGAAGQKGFSDHLQGKNHKAMEETLGAKDLEASKPELSSGDFDLSSETELAKEVKKKEEEDDAKFEGQRNTNLLGEKRKRNTTNDYTVYTTTDLCCKKPDGEWSCALCEVGATGQKGFSDNLQGKNHKAMEETLGAKDLEASKPELSSGDSDLSSETDLVKEVKKKEEEDDAKCEGQRKENTKKLKFWCEMCGVGSHSSVVMETHYKGKKHMLGLKKKQAS